MSLYLHNFIHTCRYAYMMSQVGHIWKIKMLQVLLRWKSQRMAGGACGEDKKHSIFFLTKFFLVFLPNPFNFSNLDFKWVE
jgi:hypothetical protein